MCNKSNRLFPPNLVISIERTAIEDYKHLIFANEQSAVKMVKVFYERLLMLFDSPGRYIRQRQRDKNV